jgi:hypothetical protein
MKHIFEMGNIKPPIKLSMIAPFLRSLSRLFVAQACVLDLTGRLSGVVGVYVVNLLFYSFDIGS